MKLVSLLATLITASASTFPITAFAQSGGLNSLSSNPPVRLSISVSQCEAVRTSRSVAMLSYDLIGRSAPINILKSAKDGSLKGVVHFDLANRSLSIATKFVSLSGKALAEAHGTLSLAQPQSIGSFMTDCESADEIGKYNIVVTAAPARSQGTYLNARVEQCLAPVNGKAVKKFIFDESRSIGSNFNSIDEISSGGTYQFIGQFIGDFKSSDAFAFTGVFTSSQGMTQTISSDFDPTLDSSVSTTRSCLSPEDLNQYILSVQYVPGTSAVHH